MKNNATKKALSLLMAALMVFSVLSPLPARTGSHGGVTKAQAAGQVLKAKANSWRVLREKISAAQSGDVIEIELTNDIVAEITDNTRDDGGTINISGGKTVIIKAEAGKNVTIWRKDGEANFPMFKTSNDSANLILGDGLTLSGKTCGAAADDRTIDMFHKDLVPGNAEPEEKTEPGGNQSGKVQSGDKYIRVDYYGEVKAYTEQYAATVEFEPNNGKLLVKINNKYVVSASREGVLKLSNDSSNAIFVTDTSGNPVTSFSQNTDYLLKDPRTYDSEPEDSHYVIIYDGGLYRNGSFANAAKWSSSNISSSGSGSTYWVVPGTTEPKFESAQAAKDSPEMQQYNNDHPQQPARWEIPDASGNIQTFKDPDERTQAEAAFAAFIAANPVQGCDNGNCKTYTKDDFAGGKSVDEPRGFFVEVTAGTLTIAGATLENFVTDKTVTNAAPVVAKGGTFSMSGGSIEHNAVGYSADNSFIGKPVNEIEKKIKDVKDGWTRTNTAGAIILTHGSQGNITGGTIQNNRADAGAIIVEGDGTAKKNTGTQTQLGLNGGTISNNFGVHYGGAIYIYNNGLVEMNSGAISNNFAWFKGGAVFASEEVFGSTQWGRPGTTQYVGDAAFIMKGGTLSGNMAVSRAGAIEVMSNHVILVAGDITNNSSRSLGGAIYVEGDGVDRMYTLVLQKGCISNNTAVNNVARPTDLSRVFKGNVATDCNFENILGVPGAGANIYDRGDYGGYYGHGGGIWLCSFGGNATFNINKTFNVIVDGNHAVAGRGEDIQVHVAKGGSPNGVNIVGLGNNSFVNEATGNALEEGTHYPGKLSIKNTDNRQSCDGCEGVNISGNVASNGGGIAANGTVVFGSDTNVYVPMTKIRLTKSWDKDVTKETITLKYYYKDEKGNRVQLGDLDGYQVTFNGKADSKAEAAGDNQYTENDPTWEQINDSGDSFAEMAIPWVVTVNGEKKATFILGLDNPVTINYKDARNNDKTFSGKEFDPSNDEHLAALWTGIRNGVIGGSELPNGNIVSNQLKIVKWNLEVVETNAAGKEINFTLPDGEVANLNVEAHKAQEKVFYDKAATRLASVNTSVIGFGFNTNILNAKEEEPKVEKYVNDKVHADLEYFDQVFKYSVMAYVPRNATKVVLTDTLRKDLEFVNTTPETVLTSVVVYKDNDSDANTAVGTNQLRNAGTVAKNGRSGCPVTVSEDKQTVTLTLDEAFLQTADNALFGPNGEAKDLDAVWVKMTFEVRIKKDSHAALAKKILSGKDTTEDGISWEKVTTNASTIDSNGTAHTEVANGGEHAGMANKANYKVTIKNKGESSYDTNTVTVVPKTEDLTITKKWEGDTANNRPTEDEFKAALKVQSVKGQTVTDLDPQPAATIKDNKDNTWTASWTGLPKLDGVTYQVAETKLAGYQNPTGSPAKNGETITNTKEKDTTTRKVTKVWENATEAEKTAIQVQLKKTVGNADPVNVGNPVTLNGKETTPWTYTWDGLEIEEEGEPIIYTVDEVDVPAGFTKIVAKDGTTGYKITNVKATTEKYVDKDVHSDIVNFDKEFVYDILVYVPKDATEFTITDTLVPGLEFADKDGNTSTEVSEVVKEVVWKTTNDHTAGGTVSAKAGGSFNLNTKPDDNGKTNPATIQDSTLTITIDRAAGLSGARGRWVQVTFYARIQNQYRTLDALKKLTGSWTEITNNTPVSSQIGSHEGMRNKAEYTVKFGNNGEGTYKTNTVTVKPEMVEYKAQKKWQDKDGADMTQWPAGASITFSLWKVPAVGEAECVETAAAITEDKVVTFTQQPKLKDVTYEVREEVGGVKSYQVGSPAEEPENTFTFTNRLTDKDIIPAKLKLTASKTLEGATLKKGAFKFTIEAAKGNPANHKKQTKANDKNGVVAFDALEYTVAGTYTYTIKEVLPAGVTVENPVKDGITYDTTERTVVVEVAENDGVISISKVTVDGKEVTAEGPMEYAVTVAQPFTNSFEDQPEIAKYVNQNVHTDLAAFDEKFEYDILAYITQDADSAIITDKLDAALDPVTGENAIKIYDLGTGAPDFAVESGSVSNEGTELKNLQAGFEGQEMKVEITDAITLRGHWIRIHFEAKIKDTVYEALAEKLAKINAGEANADADDAAIGWQKITDASVHEGGEPNKGDAPVTGGTLPHAGVANKASYTIKVDNESKYEDTSNTVTVKPVLTEVKVSKAWYTNGEEDAAWPEGATVEVKLTKNGVPAKDAENNEITVTLSKDQKEYTFANLPVLEGVTYGVAEGTVNDAAKQYPLRKVEKVSDGVYKLVNEKVETEKYINNDVHVDLVEFDKVFKYDILVYVAEDTTQLTITDPLVKALEFAKVSQDLKAKAVKATTAAETVGAVVVKDTNDHKVNGTVASANGTKVTPTSMSIANNTLTITFGSEENPVTAATGIRGKWLQVTFYAKYTDAVIQAAKVGDTKTITDNGLVLEGIKSHEGTVNQASATMKVENGAKAEPKTNEVTVKPETTKVEVSKTWMLDGKTAQWPEGTTVEVKLTQTKDRVTTDVEGKTDKLTAEKQSVTFDNLPCLVGVTYGVAEGTVTNAGSYAIGAVEEDPENKGVFTITNKAFTPSIEKYVNKKDAEPAVKDNTVHTDLSFFDEVYTYDILAYVTEDAKYLVVTDELVKALQFAETEPSVTVVVKAAGENGAPLLSADGEALAKTAYSVDAAAWSAGKLVLTMGSETSKTVLAQAGKWIQITFDAKIKDTYRSIEALKEAGLNAWETVTENKTDNGTRNLDKADVTADFSGATAASHEGIANDAYYTINKKAGAELDNQWQYECKSNTVTVQPKTTELKVEKLWVDADGNSIAWPEGVTITVQLQSKKGQEAPADVTGKTLTLSKDKTSDSFTGLPCLEGVIYLVKETPVDVKGQVYTPTVVYNEGKATITNKPEKPEIQKFVNKVQPHSDLKGWDSVFRYDVVVYVPTDAVKIYMTDDLVSVLELVIDAKHPVTATVADSNGIQNGETVAITKLDEGVNKGGKLYATIEDISDSSEPALRGRYVTFTFYAQIKEGADLSAYKDNDYKVPNDARYIINDNPNYGDESNVVTVKPVFEDLTITKVWEGDKADIRPTEAVFKANLKLTLGTQDVTGANADKLTIKDNQDNTWTATWTGLKKYESKQYKVTEKEALAGYMAATYSEDGKTITNKATEPEIPEIEKYVNKKNATGTAKDGGVHTDLAAFDEVYTYDIQAYIAKDATVAEITDQLRAVLEFVGEGPTEVVIKAGEEGGKAPKLSKAGAAPQDTWTIDQEAWKAGKLVLTLGKTDSTEVLKAAGQWIQITFMAKIKDVYRSIEALKAAGENVWETIVNNDPIDDAKVDSHEGIANDASYRMKRAIFDVGNDWSYNDKSNTVTVEAETTEVEVSKEWKTGTLVDQWPAGAEVEVKLIQTKDGVTTEVEGKTDKLTASKTTVIFADLPCLEGVTYGVAEGKVTNAGEYKIVEVKKVSEGVFKITNQREEEPEIEKYVNKKSATGTAKDGGVHTDLEAFDEVYTYDIQAYIAKDATVAEITDQLQKVLEFVGEGPTKVVIKAGEAYGKAPKLSKAGTAPKDAWSIDQDAWKAGKLVLTLGKADSTEVLKAAGQWIQITFNARIKSSYRDLDALKKAGAKVWSTITKNEPIDDAKVDNIFSGAKVNSHEGIVNDTSYRMKKAGVDVDNTWSYNDKSNTVTVQPKTVKVSVNKKWIGNPAEALRLALRRDGVTIETVTIKAGSKWSYEWKSLPAGYKYEVTEYVLTNPTNPTKFIQTGSDTQVDKDGNVTVSFENTRTATVKINKTDLGGEELAGAVIEVKDANREVIANWTSEEGKTLDLNLKPGKYSFKEVSAPEGYECVTTEIGFTVNDDGTVTVTTTTVDPAGAVKWTPEGEIILMDKLIEFPVKINKTDLGGTELAGAVIEVKDANREVIANWTSEEGKTLDLNLKPGEYTFREVNAPEGYERVTTEIGFTVNDDGTVTVTTTTVDPAGAVEVIDGVIILKDELKKEEPTTEAEEEETDGTEPDEGGSFPPGDEDESTTVSPESEEPETEPETEPEGTLPPSEEEETTTVAAETEVPSKPDTGDHSNLGLYIGLIAAAGVAGVGLLLATRKKKEEE